MGGTAVYQNVSRVKAPPLKDLKSGISSIFFFFSLNKMRIVVCPRLSPSLFSSSFSSFLVVVQLYCKVHLFSCLGQAYEQWLSGVADTTPWHHQPNKALLLTTSDRAPTKEGHRGEKSGGRSYTTSTGLPFSFFSHSRLHTCTLLWFKVINNLYPYLESTRRRRCYAR